MENAFTLLNTVMATQTAKISLMNLTVVRHLLTFHAFTDLDQVNLFYRMSPKLFMKFLFECYNTGCINNMIFI